MAVFNCEKCTTIDQLVSYMYFTKKTGFNVYDFLRFNDKVYIAALQDFRISRSSGIMVRGPLAQLIPTTAAPASSRRRQASGIGTPSIVSSGQYGAKVMTAGTPIVQRQLKKVYNRFFFFILNVQ